MKKWKLLVIICTFIIIAAGLLWTGRSIAMTEVIRSRFDKGLYHGIETVEEMPVGDCVLYNISHEDSERILEIINDTEIRFVKFETGLEFTECIYTLTITGVGDPVSVSINESGDIHFNDKEITYSSKNGIALYERIKEVVKDYSKE